MGRKIAFAFDWLSMTFHGLDELSIRNALGFGLQTTDWTETGAMNGYKHAWKHPFGHITMSNHARPEMGVHVMFSGKPLREMREGGISFMDMLRWAHKEGAKVTRIDLAIDLHGEVLDIRDLRGCAQVKGKEGSIKKRRLVDSDEGGVTLYGGSPQSEKMVRFYDKRAEVGEAGPPWVRFEGVFKGKAARSVVAALVPMDAKKIPQYVMGLIKGLYNPDHPVFQAVMVGEAQQAPSTKNASDNTALWLNNSVAKTLARLIVEQPQHDIWGDFFDSVQANINALEGRG